MSVAGTWKVRLDEPNEGLRQSWFRSPIQTGESIRLPGTTDLAGLGQPLDPKTLRYPGEFPYTMFPGVKPTDRADERGFLARRHLVLGPVWYEREIDIPADWQNQVISLFLERVLWQSDVWVDGRHAGSENSLATPHVHELGPLVPGRHRLTLRVDNSAILDIGTVTHAYGPETQSRWNGAIGRLELRARPPVALLRFEIEPAADRRSVRLQAVIRNTTSQPVPARLNGRIEPGETPRRASIVGQAGWEIVAPAGESVHEGIVPVSPSDAAARAWDEFHPVRYRARVELHPHGFGRSGGSEWFGFRHLERRGRTLLVNGRPAFLRGTLDCAVYPRTGHPPTSTREWERILKTVQEYGFNHVRFHTWCPPEAAFEAADRLGLYLMPETATWVDDWTHESPGGPPAVGRDPAVGRFIRAEMRRIVEAYGNHPSFALFCIGNEFGMKSTDWDEVTRWVAEAKARDPRRWYVGTTARRTLPPDDVWVTHAVHGRGARGVGPATTDWDFDAAADATEVPVIAHETGQRPVFPDFGKLLPKFDGPLAPLNYLRLRDRLRASGLARQTREFERASARFQFIQYKAEHEAMRRTAEYAGYQLLMLNDFTGQSEALVGILDPFWQSKGVIAPKEVRSWNAPTIPLARFASYTWSSADTFRARLEVAHHGSESLGPTQVEWDLSMTGGRSFARGRFDFESIPTGGLTTLGSIEVPLADLSAPSALRLTVGFGSVANAWNLWVYPPSIDPIPTGIRVLTRFDDEAERALAAGERVLLLAHGFTGERAARTGFESVYWSAGWWGNAFSTLGVLTAPDHPALRGFPEDGHSDWQWQSLTQGATTFLLDGAPAGFRPIVQGVPDFHFSRLLGQVFEARVGSGRLLVCGVDLTGKLDQRHSARAFRNSLLRYLASPEFRPRHELTAAYLRTLFAPKPAS